MSIDRTHALFAAMRAMQTEIDEKLATLQRAVVRLHDIPPPVLILSDMVADSDDTSSNADSVQSCPARIECSEAFYSVDD